MGENSHEVTWAMKNKLDDIKQTLPRNVRVEEVYDRTELVNHVIRTVRDRTMGNRILCMITDKRSHAPSPKIAAPNPNS